MKSFDDLSSLLALGAIEMKQTNEKQMKTMPRVPKDVKIEEIKITFSRHILITGKLIACE